MWNCYCNPVFVIEKDNKDSSNVIGHETKANKSFDDKSYSNRG